MIKWFKTHKALRQRITQLEQELHFAHKNVGELERHLSKAQARAVASSKHSYVAKVDHETRNEHGFPFGALVSKD